MELVDRPTMARVGDHGHASRSPSLPPLACSLPCVVTFVCMQLSASLSELIDLQFGDPYTSYYTHACTPTDDDDVHPSFHVPVVAWNVPAMPHASRPSLLHLQIRENGNACTVDEPRSKVTVTGTWLAVYSYCVSSPHVKVNMNAFFSFYSLHLKRMQFSRPDESNNSNFD